MNFLSRIKYEIWDVNNLSKYIVNNPNIETYRTNKGKLIYSNFKYFGPYFLSKIKNIIGKDIYIKSELINQLEIQEDNNTNPNAYHRFIVALDNNQIVGIHSVLWIFNSTDSEKKGFWTYFLWEIEVHKDYQNKMKIGLNLLKKLENAEFLKNHILLMTRTYTITGKNFLEKHNDILKGNTYALLPADYSRTFAPKKVGKYDSIGRKLN